MFMTMFRMKTRFTGWAAMLAILLVMPLTLPTPARAASTTNWRCNTRADQPQVRKLSGSDLARPSTDRRVYDLDCTFTATAPGPSPVTLCVSAPEGENAGGPLRRLKRRGGNEMIAYRLTAQTGDVRGAVSFPVGELRQTLQRVYTVQVGGSDVGTEGSFRHQLALVTEFQGTGEEIVAGGDYSDTLTGLVISIHEGGDCGFLLWGPPADSLGAAAKVGTSLEVDSGCLINITQNIDFGSVTGIRSDLEATPGSIDVRCNDGISYQVGMRDGENATSTTRRMALLGGPTGFVPYQLILPDGKQWSSKGSTIPGSSFIVAPDGAVHTISVRGRILAGTALPSVGDYSDAVIVEIVIF